MKERHILAHISFHWHDMLIRSIGSFAGLAFPGYPFLTWELVVNQYSNSFWASIWPLVTKFVLNSLYTALLNPSLKSTAACLAIPLHKSFLIGIRRRIWNKFFVDIINYWLFVRHKCWTLFRKRAVSVLFLSSFPYFYRSNKNRELFNYKGIGGQKSKVSDRVRTKSCLTCWPYWINFV